MSVAAQSHLDMQGLALVLLLMSTIQQVITSRFKNI